MNTICQRIHRIANSAKRYCFYDGYRHIPLNGIYIMFENGELAHGVDRIVRIGTHTGENQLPSRIKQHFENENKNRSIFRKNVGRCFLNGHPYSEKWEFDTTSRKNRDKYLHLIDSNVEKEVEKKISQYIQSNLSFTVIPVIDRSKRLQLESMLIGSISQCSECSPSEKWLGLNSPIKKISGCGLWQVQGLYKNALSSIDVDFIENAMRE